MILLCSISIFGQANCNDQTACNYDPSAIDSSECLYQNDLCDDGNVSTIDDAIDDKCDCTGVLNLAVGFSISDPCNCLNPNNIDLDMDNSIDLIFETVIITGPAGLVWSLSSGTGLLDANGNVLSSVATTETGSGIFEASFYHAPDAGYFSTWSNGSDSVLIMNTCGACVVAAAVPTMSEWGLIILALLALNFVLLFQISSRLQTANNITASINWKQSQFYPFSAKHLNQAAVLTIGLVVVLGGFSILQYGYISLTDLIGGSIAGPIFMYLIHLCLLENDQD